MVTDQDILYMQKALREAEAAARADEVPVGAVVVYEEKVIGRAHNQRELLADPTAHAEMLALTQAASYLENWRLLGCTLYVTLEPCPMCAGAMVLARIDRVVFGTTDPKAGACQTLYRIADDERLNHRVEVVSGVLAQPCEMLLKDFFAKKRNASKNRNVDNSNRTH